VASPRALAGLSARPGVDVLCARDDADWVRQVTRLLEYREFAGQIAGNAYQWVRHAHDWPRLAGRLRDVLSAAAALPRVDRMAFLEDAPCPPPSKFRRTCVPAQL
jgi:spore maturation protein CgeB